MKYITLNDLSETIRKNIWKIPRDIDFIIGIPRSGMIAASIISSYLNVPLIDVNSFIAGLEPTGGARLGYFNYNHHKTNKVLVIDDTVSSGRSMTEQKKKISEHGGELEFIYMCVYLEGWGEKVIDLYLEDVRKYTKNFTEIVYYEWNIFQHHSDEMKKFLFDIDGVFCLDPPDERNEEEYIKYIKNATPLFIPRTKIGGIITYRINKNKEITRKWLDDNGIMYNELITFNANSWDERHKSGISPEKYKGEYYKQHNNYKLFIESSDYQAKRIAEISSKPVYCVETNKLYQIEKNKNNVDIFIGAYKTFVPAVTNKIYKIIVGNNEIENKSNLKLIKCKHDEELDDKFYSEIYMLKWIYKNYPLKDYVGFCHYRKYFSFMDNVPDFDEIFKENDVIIGKPIKYARTIKDMYDKCHNIEDLEIVGNIIKEKYSDYYDTYNKYIKQHSFVPYNMFVMKKEDFLKYMKFMEDILDEYVKIVGTDIQKRIEENKEKYIKKIYPDNTFEYQYRIGGYLAERLTGIFICKNFKKARCYDIKITEKKYEMNYANRKKLYIGRN